MSFDVSWVYEIVDKYSAPIRKITKATATARRGINKASNALKKMSDKMAGIKGAVGSVAGLAAIAFPTKKAIDFESVMIDVKKVVSFKTPDQFNKFREGIFKTAIELGKVPKNIADIAVEGGKLGILPKKLGEFINLVARTSTAFDMLEGPAGAAIGSIKTKLGLTIKETGGLMDAINFLADNTATSGKRAVEVVSRTVGTMKAIKMPPELVAGWAAFADQMEVSPELAASGLNMMIKRMMKMPGMMKKMLKDPSTAIRDFLGKFSKMSEASKARKIFKKFGDEAGNFVLKAVNSQELLNKTLGLVGKGSKFAGSMQRELVAKMAGAETALGKIKAVADVAFIQMGDAIIPIIKDLTPSIVKVVSGFRDFVKLNPMLTKIGIAILAITITVTALSVVVGLMASGFAAMAAMAASALLPIIGISILIAAAIAGVIAGFVYLYNKSEKVREAVSRLGEAFRPIFEPIGELIDWVVGKFSDLWGEMGGGGAVFEFFENEISGAINTIASIIEGLINAIKTVWGWGKKVGGVLGEIGSELANQEMGRRSFSSKSLAAEKESMKGQINGRIEVAASQGSEVKSFEIDHSVSGNVGMNMAGAY